MFYALSQVLDFLATPSDLIAILGGLGVVFLILRRRRAATALLTVCALALIVAGFSPLGALAVGQLEGRFPATTLPPVVAGIVVLGGSVDTHITRARRSPTLNDAGERLTAALGLALAYPTARLILAGGGADHSGDEPATESSISRDILVGMGLAAGRVELEELSRNTCEDAEESGRLAAPGTGQVWLLVTSASHMPRAIACFRAAGFAVIPYPVDYRTRGAEDATRPATSISTGLSLLDLAAHEWLGLATYRLSGRTDELFPAR